MMHCLRSLSLLLLLTGCYNLSRLEDVGDAPNVTPIKDPTKLPNHHPVTMPMPEPQHDHAQMNSLWRQGSRGFFKDQRAKRIGDILTVKVNISGETLKFENNLSRSHTSSENLKIPTLMGFEKYYDKILPNGFDKNNLLDASNSPSYDGKGSTERSETVAFDLAAEIIQILPNGNYVISGRQEIRGNGELRELSLKGIARPEDITSANTITMDKIAEGRIIYGGRGDLSDEAHIPYGQKLVDTISPF
jgi:flagellar L-ring protein precursor FlgH